MTARVLRGVVSALVLGTATGCGTLSGVVAGPVMGGTSLTSRFLDSDAHVAAKVIGTPIVFAAGTAGGIVPATVKGVQFDGGYIGEWDWDNDEFVQVLDPFSAGLFE